MEQKDLLDQSVVINPADLHAATKHVLNYAVQQKLSRDELLELLEMIGL